MMKRTILLPLSLLSCLLSVAHPCGAETDFDIRNKEGLGRNPAGLRLLLHTTDGRSTFHLFETIPIEMEFSSSRSSAYSIELDEVMNSAGQANQFEVSPKDSVLLPFPAFGSRVSVCCDSNKRYLSSQPTTLKRELTDYLRFERAGTYSVFLVTRRVFRRLGKPNDFNPSELSLTSNVLTLTILPDDPVWDSQTLAEALRKLNDPHIRADYAAALHRAKKLEHETEQDFAMANRVSQTEFVCAQKALNALDTEEAIRERVKLMQMESKSDLEMSRMYGTGSSLSQPLLESTTRADLVVAALKEQAEQSGFGVDYDYFHWWLRFLLQRDDPEVFRPFDDDVEHQKRIHDYNLFNIQAQQELLAFLETLRANKTGDAAEITALTIKVARSLTSRSQ
jgi:hypothetical protein